MRHWGWTSAGLALTLLSAVVGCGGCRTPEVPPASPQQAPAPSRPAPAPAPAPRPAEPVAKAKAPVRIRLFHGLTEVTLHCDQPLRVQQNGVVSELPPGVWTVKPVKAAPPRQRFHVFIKTFKPGEVHAMQAYLGTWRAQGYPAEPVPLGLRFETESGRLLDGRENWISLQRFENEKDANALKTALERENQWAWVRPQIVLPGSGAVTAASTTRQTATWSIPVVLESGAPVRVVTSMDRAGHTYAGKLDLAVEPDTKLGVYETLPVEDYLAGVLPAEMPALWPAEALKAQAIAARSDVLEHMALKHVLEGFNFTNSEGDRVYAGYGGRQPATDAALQATRGQVLSDGVRIIPAVFNSNCGGWTEDNDAVWSSPPDASLRGRADFPAGKRPSASPAASLSKWLGYQPTAYCSSDRAGFRWTRRVTVAELSRLVNQKYKVGAIRSIEPGDRGASGRLKWVKVVGSQGTVTIRKELPIRQAFGGLPSAMVLIREEHGAGGAVTFTFVGGGRGHGVGLCQHGARGMALQGLGYRDIVQHYFSGATLEFVR